ncbi:MAG: lysine biosynthesis protein LysW [Candidatus Gracilibacteria bacterium]|nr:lysine biosynthesis protein LysW [Candidatus Gracilibacteria bacterium]
MSSATSCPECNKGINLEGGEIGDYFECDACLCDLTIVSLQPPKIDVVVEEK